MTSAKTFVLFWAVDATAISIRDGPETETFRVPSQLPFMTLPENESVAAEADPAKTMQAIAAVTDKIRTRALTAGSSRLSFTRSKTLCGRMKIRRVAALHDARPPWLVLVREPDELGLERANPQLALGV